MDCVNISLLIYRALEGRMWQQYKIFINKHYSWFWLLAIDVDHVMNQYSEF